MKRTIFLAITILLLALPAALHAAKPGYSFPPVDSLPDNPLMPDPLRRQGKGG